MMNEITMTVFSWFILVLGLSYLLQSENWIRLAQTVEDEAFRFYPLLLFMLVMGLVVVSTHNLWVLKWHVAITILGWILVIKSIIYLLFTSWIDKLILSEDKMRLWIKISGALFTLVGLILVYQVILGS